MAAHAMLKILDRKVVVVSALAIDPIIWGNHVIGIERGDHIVHHIFLRQAQLTRVYAIHVEAKRRIVHILRNVDLADAVQLPKAARQGLGDAINLVQIRAADLHVDGSGRARIQNGIDHGTAGKKCAYIRILARHRLLHPVHICKTAQVMRFVERHLDSCRIRTRVRGIERGKIGDHSDVRDDSFEVPWFHLVPDQIFYLCYILIRDLDASPSRNFDVDGELPGIRLGKKRQAQQRIDRQAQQEHAAQNQNRHAGPHQRPPHPEFVIIQKPVKHSIEPGIEAVHP